MKKQYFVGIDGGASKTEAVLLDSDGRMLAHEKLGPSAIVGNPKPHSLKVLKSLFMKLCAKSEISEKEVSHCAIGLNGIDFADEYQSQFDIIAGYLGFSNTRLSLVNDGIAALWGSSSSPASVILQHGSGITSAYRDNYGNEQLYDHLNSCHCFDMRSEIYTLVARMIAGATTQTRLMDAVLEQLQLKPAQFFEFYYRMQYQKSNNSNNWIFPVMVFDLWNNGDAGAKFLVERTMDDYVALLGGMIAKSGQKNVVAVLGGGVVKLAPQNFMVETQRKLAVRCHGAILQSPEFSPSVGAAILAAFKSGLNIKDYYTKLTLTLK